MWLLRAYEDAALKSDIDLFLGQHGIVEVEMEWIGPGVWGDCQLRAPGLVDLGRLLSI